MANGIKNNNNNVPVENQGLLNKPEERHELLERSLLGAFNNKVIYWHNNNESLKEHLVGRIAFIAVFVFGTVDTVVGIVAFPVKSVIWLGGVIVGSEKPLVSFTGLMRGAWKTIIVVPLLPVFVVGTVISPRHTAQFYFWVTLEKTGSAAKTSIESSIPSAPLAPSEPPAPPAPPAPSEPPAPPAPPALSLPAPPAPLAPKLPAPPAPKLPAPPAPKSAKPSAPKPVIPKPAESYSFAESKTVSEMLKFAMKKEKSPETSSNDAEWDENNNFDPSKGNQDSIAALMVKEKPPVVQEAAEEISVWDPNPKLDAASTKELHAVMAGNKNKHYGSIWLKVLFKDKDVMDQVRALRHDVFETIEDKVRQCVFFRVNEENDDIENFEGYKSENPSLLAEEEKAKPEVRKGTVRGNPTVVPSKVELPKTVVEAPKPPTKEVFANHFSKKEGKSVSSAPKTMPAIKKVTPPALPPRPPVAADKH